MSEAQKKVAEVKAQLNTAHAAFGEAWQRRAAARVRAAATLNCWSATRTEEDRSVLAEAERELDAANRAVGAAQAARIALGNELVEAQLAEMRERS